MRTSTDSVVKLMFTNKLSKTGNLTMAYEEPPNQPEKASKKSKWGAALVAEKQKGKVCANVTSFNTKRQVIFFFF